jgi:hypothetical protein
MIRRAALTATLVVVTGLLGACGSGNDSASTDTANTAGSVAAASAPGPTSGGVVEVIAGAPGEAGTAACDLTRQTLELAADAYAAVAGELPSSQSELLGQGLIREESPWFEFSAEGEVVPTPGSPCA